MKRLSRGRGKFGDDGYIHYLFSHYLLFFLMFLRIYILFIYLFLIFKFFSWLSHSFFFLKCIYLFILI